MQAGYSMTNMRNIIDDNVKFLLIIAPSFENFQYFVKLQKMGVEDIEILTLIQSEDGQVIRLSSLKVLREAFTSNYIYKREAIFTFTRHAFGAKVQILNFSLNLFFRYCLKTTFFLRPICLPNSLSKIFTINHQMKLA